MQMLLCVCVVCVTECKPFHICHVSYIFSHTHSSTGAPFGSYTAEHTPSGGRMWVSSSLGLSLQACCFLSCAPYWRLLVGAVQELVAEPAEQRTLEGLRQ